MERPQLEGEVGRIIAGRTHRHGRPRRVHVQRADVEFEIRIDRSQEEPGDGVDTGKAAEELETDRNPPAPLARAQNGGSAPVSTSAPPEALSTVTDRDIRLVGEPSRKGSAGPSSGHSKRPSSPLTAVTTPPEVSSLIILGLSVKKVKLPWLPRTSGVPRPQSILAPPAEAGGSPQGAS